MICGNLVKYLQEVNICGFISWVDDEWPSSLNNALSKLWGMYHNSNCSRIDDKIEHARFVEEISLEKKTLEKKHHALLDDFKNFADNVSTKVMPDNCHNMNAQAREEEYMENIKKELHELKEKKKSWEAKREAMKEEKKKLEHMLYDLFNDGASNKNKLKRIKDILDK
jgi:hypothetical protein